MRRIAHPLPGVLPALLVALVLPSAAFARPYGAYPGHGGAWAGWGPGSRPGWGAGYRPGWGGWGYRPYYPYRYGWGYGYGYGYGWGLATGAALGWSLAGPWWPPATYWGGPAYVIPSAYFPYGGVTVMLPATAPIVERQVSVPPPPQHTAPPATAPTGAGHWYYCNAPAGYFPAVNACTQPWIAVTPHGSGTDDGPPRP